MVLYTSALVLSVALNVDLVITLVIVGLISIIYTSIGGITADIYSDAIQLIVLFSGAAVALLIVLISIGGLGAFSTVNASIKSTVFLDGFGISGDNYSVWPMLIGGFFLYFSY